MSRTSVTVREAVLDDAPFLAELWADGLRRADHHEQVADLETIIKAASASPDERLVVAEHDGRPAGAVLLRLGTVSPLNLEPTVQVLSPHVLPSCRRRGVGRTLMEQAATFAEEVGVPTIATAAGSSSRDANRFMARLAFAPHATVRLAPTAAVRARLTAQRPPLTTTASGRQVTRVLAARRSMRRSQAAG